MKKRWTKEEDAIVMKLYPDAPRRQILDALPGRRWEYIIKRGQSLGVRRRIYLPGQHPWTPQEDDILAELFGTTHKRDLEEALPKHTYNSIQKRARHLGLRSNGSSEKTAGINPNVHHREMIRKYFPGPLPVEKSLWVELLQEGVVAMVRRINAGRMDARDLRR